MQFEINHWIRDADLINADLKEASAGLISITSAIRTQCDNVQMVTRLAECAGHRECRGQAGRGEPYGSSTEHAYNCSLSGTRLGCEGTASRRCSASINQQELRMLNLASQQIEKITVGIHTWYSPLKEASKVEAVMKALVQVHRRFFNIDGRPNTCRANLGNFRYVHSCDKPLVDQALNSTFRDVQSRLVSVLDDLHLGKVLSSILAMRPFHSTAPAAEVLGRVDQPDHAVTEQVVQHMEEPAIRDEELVQLQAEHDWADGVVNMITDPTLPNISDPAEPDTEQVFLFRFSRTPPEFKNFLEHGAQLATVRDKMAAAGCACTLPPPHAGAKVFVWPEQYPTVMDAIGELEKPLFSSNVVILESLMPCLEDLVAAIPRKANVHEKERQAFTSVACMAEACPQADSLDNYNFGNLECVLAEVRTFLCIVRILKEHVNQSTTEAHGGVNPRRYALDSDSASSTRRKFRGISL